MIFIGGVSQGTKILPYAGTLLCGYCGTSSACQIVMTYYYFSFFFIPLFKWNKRFYVKMACCDAVYELSPEIGKAIARGEQAVIPNEALRIVQEGRRTAPRYGTRTDEDIDPSKPLRCPICKYEAPGDSNYCPKCGQRLR